MAVVTLDAITKRFGAETAVDGIDLTIEDGEVLGVVGPSGCGKTTTLRTIAGFETPTEGRVLFDDEDVTHVPPEQRNVGLVFQSYALFDNMSVRANVAFGPKMQGVPKDERRERADELLELLGIDELADRDPTTLSGGQQQRVGLARALAIEPNILLLDEPMTGLDAKLKERLRVEIGELLDELGVTTLYVTHDQEEAMVMCDRIAVLSNGTIEQVGTPEEIYERPENEFVADFVGTSNLLGGTVENGAIELADARITPEQLPSADGEVTVSARPAAFSIGDGPIEATVVGHRYLGDAVRIEAELSDGRTVTLEPSAGVEVSTGEEIRLTVDSSKVHVIE